MYVERIGESVYYVIFFPNPFNSDASLLMTTGVGILAAVVLLTGGGLGCLLCLIVTLTMGFPMFLPHSWFPTEVAWMVALTLVADVAVCAVVRGAPGML